MFNIPRRAAYDDLSRGLQVVPLDERVASEGGSDGNLLRERQHGCPWPQWLTRGLEDRIFDA